MLDETRRMLFRQLGRSIVERRNALSKSCVVDDESSHNEFVKKNKKGFRMNSNALASAQSHEEGRHVFRHRRGR
ncbi:hypothetical protein EGY31_17575 [Burkholderia multivorans]|uniref:Uncharacterized protein n=1 Tax=Burkholderia ubonensis TaxID=101571 RepID=A0A1R1J5D6_9BURK|nr:hypothetical protein EGY31_17575 [Burkholderia multivorans]OMG70522.1 hypothetical protein BW685_26595 [Burkholderia ubonensis]